MPSWCDKLRRERLRIMRIIGRFSDNLVELLEIDWRLAKNTDLIWFSMIKIVTSSNGCSGGRFDRVGRSTECLCAIH